MVSASNVNGESERSSVLTVYVAKEPEAPASPVETQIKRIDSTG
jgi:hypothetical protein